MVAGAWRKEVRVRRRLGAEKRQEKGEEASIKKWSAEAEGRLP